MANNFIGGEPGLKTTRTATPRTIQWGSEDGAGASFIPGGRVIDGSLSRDPLNTGDTDVLRAGMLMGKITTGGKYAPSIIGTLGDAYDGAATQMNLLYATEAAEVTRRIGASGTFKITGPPTASGTVQTQTVTYSAVGSGTGGDEVQTFTSDADSTAGTYRIKLAKPDGTYVYTAAIASGAATATVQAAITLALGAVAGWVATSGGTTPFFGGPDTLILTASGTGYLKTDFPMCSIDVSSLTGVTSTTDVQTTRGIPVAGTITVTALGAAVNAVQTITIGGTHTGGTLKLGFREVADPDGAIIWTDTIAWHATEATMTASVNAALDNLLGASVVVCSTIADTAATVLVLTFSGTGAASLAQEEVHVDTSAYTGASTVSVAMTTAGVTASANDFIAGSLIQPTDGSEQIRAIVYDGYGIKVTDRDSADIDVQFPTPMIGGTVNAANIINVPTDPSLLAYVKADLREHGIGYAFDDDF